MKRRAFMGTLAGGLLAAPLAAEAQEARKVARIGVLNSGSPPAPFVESFKQGLRELGYVEGRNISIEYRWAEGRNERLPGLAADLVRLKVDVIVASSQAAVAAKQATTAIPIVMPIITDPVRLGLVASLARPGGNATGFATQNDEAHREHTARPTTKRPPQFDHAWDATGRANLATHTAAHHLRWWHSALSESVVALGLPGRVLADRR